MSLSANRLQVFFGYLWGICYLCLSYLVWSFTHLIGSHGVNNSRATSILIFSYLHSSTCTSVIQDSNIPVTRKCLHQHLFLHDVYAKDFCALMLHSHRINYINSLFNIILAFSCQWVCLLQILERWKYEVFSCVLCTRILHVLLCHKFALYTCEISYIVFIKISLGWFIVRLMI
jgi:hypothetical protein